MTETPIPYPRARAALTFTGWALVALDVLVAALPDSAMGGRGAGIPVVFWASAAACFVCSFVLSMTEEAP
jgi:hypothetical protein